MPLLFPNITWGMQAILLALSLLIWVQPSVAAQNSGLLEKLDFRKAKAETIIEQKCSGSYLTSLSISADGLKIALYGALEGGASILSSESGTPIAGWRGGGQIMIASFSPDGTKFAGVTDAWTSNRLIVQDLRTRELKEIGAPGHSIFSFAFSRDGSKIMTSSFDHYNSTGSNSTDSHKIHVWETQTGKHLLTLTKFQNGLADANADPAGSQINLLDWDLPIAFQSRSSKIQVLGERSYFGSDILANGASLSPDKTKLATFYSNTVTIWDVATGRALKALQHPKGQHVYNPVKTASFSRDGSRLVTADEKGTAVLWNLQNALKPHRAFQGQGYIHSALFGPNDSTVILGYFDKSIVWDIESDIVISTIESRSHDLLLKPDKGRVLSIADEGDPKSTMTTVVKIWNVGPTAQELEDARRLLNNRAVLPAFDGETAAERFKLQ